MNKYSLIYIAFPLVLLVSFGCRKKGNEFIPMFEKFYGEYHYGYSNYDVANFVSPEMLGVDFGIVIENKKLQFFRNGKHIRTYRYYSNYRTNKNNDYNDRVLIFKKQNEIFEVTFDLSTFDSTKMLMTNRHPVKQGVNYYIKKY